jgi:alpha-1,2-mannosyltransferase
MMAMIRRFLVPRRLRYAWIAGGALWVAWLLSVFLGPGKLDLAGTPIGTDYLQFYAAGTTVRIGESCHLYDMAYQVKLEQEIIGPGLTSYHAFITPPFLAWLFVPFSMVGYTASLVLWSLLGLLLLWSSLRLLRVVSPARTFVWSLTFFPFFAAISFGQNALLSLFIFAAAYRLWHDGRLFPAGLVLSLALYKPQLIVGVAFLWLLDYPTSWRALLGLGLGGAVLVAVSFGLTPEAGIAYLEFARTTLPDLTSWQNFPIWHLHTLRGFWRLLFPWWPWLGDALTIVLSGGAAWGFVRFWRRFRAHKGLLFASTVVLSLCLTPHAMIYDWSLMLIPAMLFQQEFPSLQEHWRAEYALVWLVALVSGPLSYVQLRLLPMALQVSVPILGIVAARVWRSLMCVEMD